MAKISSISSINRLSDRHRTSKVSIPEECGWTYQRCALGREIIKPKRELHPTSP